MLGHERGRRCWQLRKTGEKLTATDRTAHQTLQSRIHFRHLRLRAVVAADRANLGLFIRCFTQIYRASNDMWIRFMLSRVFLTFRIPDRQTPSKTAGPGARWVRNRGYRSAILRSAL